MDEEDGFRRTPASWTNALLKVAREHLALLVPIVGVLIFALRCVFVSEGDPYVAAMLVSTTSVGDAIRALFFTVVPILLFGLSWVIPIVVSQQIAPRRWREPRILGLLSVSPAALLGYFYFSGGSWIFRGLGQRHMVLYAIISFVLFLPLLMFLTLGIIQEHYDTKMRLELGISLRSSGFPPFAVAGVLLAAAVVLALGASFGTRTFWLPRERLSFNGEAPFTGYVLKASDDQLTILHDRPRIIIEKPKAALQDRDFCYPEDHKARSSKVAADSPVCP